MSNLLLFYKDHGPIDRGSLNVTQLYSCDWWCLCNWGKDSWSRLSRPRKRRASRLEDNRLVKRPLTSDSPEEGELDDPLTVPFKILPISLPPKHPPPINRVPFPFKKKIENPSVGEKQGNNTSQCVWISQKGSRRTKMASQSSFSTKDSEAGDSSLWP